MALVLVRSRTSQFSNEVYSTLLPLVEILTDIMGSKVSFLQSYDIIYGRFKFRDLSFR